MMTTLKKWIGFLALATALVATVVPIAAAQIWPSGCEKCDYSGEDPKCVEVTNTWNQGWETCRIKEFIFWTWCSVSDPCPIQV